MKMSVRLYVNDVDTSRFKRIPPAVLNRSSLKTRVGRHLLPLPDRVGGQRMQAADL